MPTAERLPRKPSSNGPSDASVTRPFTGRHMAVIICSFFGVVIAVNLLMATLATRTFGGTVVDNSYVASQKFNGWLAEARAQRALGWEENVRLDQTRRVRIAMSVANEPLAGARVEGYARHPLGRAADVPLSFTPQEPGQFTSVAPLPAGRWILHLAVTRGSDQADFVADLR